VDFQQVKECTCKLGSGSARQEELPASYESGLAARQRMGEHMWMHRSGHKLAACAITVLHPYAKHPCGLFWGGGGGGGKGVSRGTAKRVIREDPCMCIWRVIHSLNSCAVLYREQAGGQTMKNQKTHAHPPDRRADPFPVAGSSLAS
jgi:hypothetical protein